MFTPVYDLNGKLIGIIRMTTRVVTVSDEIYQLRYLLGAILLFGVLAGIGLGSYLAVSINRPIQRTKRSIQALVDGERHVHVEEQGLEETRTLAKAFNSLVDQLNNLEQARRQLLANLVHELGRPLGAIRSAIQALLKGADQDPQLAADLLIGMEGETARLQRLLENLAGLHEQTLGKLELNFLPVRLVEWLPSVLSPWEAAAREKGLIWDEKIEPGLPSVKIDPDRVAQALGNLLSNAIKFTPTGGQVCTTIEMGGGKLIMQVSDTGPGIPVEEQEKIFQSFFRGGQGRRIVQGMGLGLNIARDIITAHGGEIILTSLPGSGSSFELQIPVEVNKVWE